MTELSFRLEDRVVRSPDAVHAQVDREVVMMSLVTGRYCSLTGAGGRIWELIEHPTTVGELCERLTDEYDVDAARCRTEVTSFLTGLAEQGLLGTPSTAL